MTDLESDLRDFAAELMTAARAEKVTIEERVRVLKTVLEVHAVLTKEPPVGDKGRSGKRPTFGQMQDRIKAAGGDADGSRAASAVQATVGRA